MFTETGIRSDLYRRELYNRIIRKERPAGRKLTMFQLFHWKSVLLFLWDMAIYLLARVFVEDATRAGIAAGFCFPIPRDFTNTGYWKAEMSSVTRFGQFSSKNWVLRADFWLQYPRGAVAWKVPAGRRETSSGSEVPAKRAARSKNETAYPENKTSCQGKGAHK